MGSVSVPDWMCVAIDEAGHNAHAAHVDDVLKRRITRRYYSVVAKVEDRSVTGIISTNDGFICVL